MARTKGSDWASITKRQRLVLRYFLRGLGPEEIAASLHTDASTIYRDLEQIRTLIKEKVEVADLWPIRKHFAIVEELIRETFAIYHRPKERRSDGQGEIDDSFRKLAALGLLHKIVNSTGKLAFGQKIEFKEKTPEARTELREAINALTQEERMSLAEIMERIQHPKTSTGT